MKIVIPGILFILIIAGYATACWMEIGKHTDKLWLHRCNSVEKYEEMKERFPNIETDIILRENSTAGFFDVTHDEEVSFHLPLDSILAHLRANREGKIWLDIKNLNTSNCLETRERLTKILETYGICKEKVIIESNSSEALEPFTKIGYYTSYYVYLPHPSDLSQEKQDSCISLLQEVVDSKRVCALSFPFWWYAPIKSGLDRETDLLTWMHRTTEWEFFLLPWKRKVLDDDQVKVILIKSKGNFHR